MEWVISLYLVSAHTPCLLSLQYSHFSKCVAQEKMVVVVVGLYYLLHFILFCGRGWYTCYDVWVELGDNMWESVPSFYCVALGVWTQVVNLVTDKHLFPEPSCCSCWVLVIGSHSVSQGSSNTVSCPGQPCTCSKSPCSVSYMLGLQVYNTIFWRKKILR